MTHVPLLGKLETVPVTEVWSHEAYVFTPWLLENADRLGDALGMDLELTVNEHPIGDFYLDLLGHDISTGETVIVENQLQKTDHSHLGQLLTYAAGVDEVSNIVWVAPEFRQEHRAALDWLNTHTQEGTRFFGVQISAVRIGDSAPAPLFTVVSQPNDWAKSKKTAAQSQQQSPGVKGVLYQQFWQELLDRLKAEKLNWSKGKAPTTSHFDMPGGGQGLIWGVSFAKDSRLRSELYFDNASAQQNQAMFARLLDVREQFEAEYGGQLHFDPLEGKKACRIEDQTGPAAVDQRESWPAYLDWMVETQTRLRRAFACVGGISYVVGG
ncbi:DUF4268 domain-containing protein [Blastococcus sp. KM273129]|uniref:DUF4268 domain-containing protein n=2 Tax=unclassified Blastococcus TaxID=2619396 RepID=UPI001F15A008|nr:DUF4268 domain-containing protein [Blastococcus sp. KM273129]MCF6734077.1 DUF4268 domain-containing protein [Blastococcus sp. KM273129]